MTHYCDIESKIICVGVRQDSYGVLPLVKSRCWVTIWIYSVSEVTAAICRFKAALIHVISSPMRISISIKHYRETIEDVRM